MLIKVGNEDIWFDFSQYVLKRILSGFLCHKCVWLGVVNMDRFGFLASYLEDNYEESGGQDCRVEVDKEYNWHPIFLTQESRGKESNEELKEDQLELDTDGWFDSSECVQSKNVPFEPMIFNQKMTESVQSVVSKEMQVYSPTVEDISDDESANYGQNVDGIT